MNDLLTGRRLTFWTALKLLWHLPTLLQLLVRLLGDARVAVGTKTLFAGMILFILSPFDVPNFVPVLGQVSDVVLALLASRWFLSACPAETVTSHLGEIRGRLAVPSEDPAARFIGLPR